MPHIWTPESARSEIREASEASLEADRIVEFTRRLKALDSRLDLFLQTEDREELRQGFYYVRRQNDDGTLSTFEISTPDGSYREPDEQVLEALRASDSWSRDVWRDIERARNEKQRRMERERERVRDEECEHLQEELDYRFRTQLRPGDTRRLAVER